MELENNPSKIFYITLSSNLNKSYYQLARKFRDISITLVPVTLDQFVTLSRGQHKIHAICSVKNVNEYRSYKKAVFPLIKNMILNKRMTLFLLSSFQKLDMRSEYGVISQFHFISLPIRMESFVKKCASIYLESASQKDSWPGGTRVRLPFDPISEI